MRHILIHTLILLIFSSGSLKSQNSVQITNEQDILNKERVKNKLEELEFRQNNELRRSENNSGFLPLITGPEQDCGGAIPVCQQTYNQQNSYTGYGSIQEISGTCLLGGENYSVWYVFTVQNSGTFGFDLQTQNDYDFALYDITNVGCAGISGATPVRCNFSATYGTTGLSLPPSSTVPLSYSASAGPMMPGLNVNAGTTYALIIDNWSQDNNGYTLNFNGTASIFDNNAPSIQTTTGSCTQNSMVITLDEPIECGTVASDGSDFTITGPSTVNITSATGVGCSGNLTSQVEVFFVNSPAINSGNYVLSVQTGTDGNTIVDKCGNSLAAGTIFSFDYLSDVTITSTFTDVCAGDTVTLTLNGLPSSGAVVSWTPGGQTTNTLTTIPNSTTTFSASVTYGGCTKSAFLTINVVNPPSVTATPLNQTICSGTATITATSVMAGVPCTSCDYVWTGGTSQTDTAVAFSTVSGLSAGSYDITVFSATGCQGNSITATVNSSTSPPTPACNILYVTPSASGGGLTPANPASLDSALALGQCNNVIIKMAQGTYGISAPITNITSFMTIEGGYDISFSTKTSEPGYTRILRNNSNVQGFSSAPRLVAFQITGASFFRLQDLTIEVDDAPVATLAEPRGVSLYGIHLTNCSDYDIVRCQVITGDASQGFAGQNAGSPGLPGSPGSNGTQGDNDDQNNAGNGGGGGAGAGTGSGGGGSGGNNPGCCTTGNGGNSGSAASSARAGGGGGGGGSGGTEDNNGGSGASGGNGGAGAGAGGGGLRGTESGCDANQNAQAGSVGTAGSNGTAGTSGSIGTHIAGFWNPGGQGGIGTDGAGGAGGGGGGGGAGEGGFFCIDGGGSGGGGGGGGGQGGTGGDGGWGGGSAYGIYLFGNGASTRVTDCFFIQGSLGAGGSGASGGTGGSGGSQGSGSGYTGGGEVGAGANGGAGGKGGDGGNGGNGGNGESNNVLTDVSSTVLSNQTTVTLTTQDTITTDNINCTDVNINYNTAASASSWTQMGVGSSPSTGSGTSVVTQYTNTGRKTIQKDGNIYTDFANIFSSPTPGTVVISDTIICPGTFNIASSLNGLPGYSYTWSSVNPEVTIVDTDSAETDFSVINVSGDTAFYSISLNVFSQCCGALNPVTVNLVVLPSAVDPTAVGGTACSGESITLYASSSDSTAVFEWYSSVTGGTPVGVGNQFLYSPVNNDDTLYVEAVNSLGCGSTSRIPAYIIEDTIGPSPVPIPSTACDTGIIMVSVQPDSGSVFNWYADAAGTTLLQSSTFNTYGVYIGTPGGTDTVYVSMSTIYCSGGPLVPVPVYVDTNVIVTNPVLDTLCPGDSTVLNLNATAGGDPITYSWFPVNASDSALANPTVFPSSSTTFGVILTTPQCSKMEFLPVVVGGNHVVSALGTSPLCDGGGGGIVTANVTGGISPYSYLWDNAETTSSVTGLSSGTYGVTVTDAAGCIDSSSTSISNPPAIVPIIIKVVDATCFGGNDGMAIATASGGVSPYEFYWQGPNNMNQFNDTASNLFADTLTLTIIDGNLCQKDTQVTVGQPTEMIIATTFDSSQCSLPNGAAIALAGGGTPGYTYIWNDSLSQTTPSATNLMAGDYWVTVTDAAGCSDSIMVSVIDSNEVIAGFSANPENGDPPLTVNLTNNTLGADNYIWSIEDTIFNSTDGSHVFNSSGTYNVLLTASNVNGCVDTFSVEILVNVFSSMVFPNVFSPNGDGQNDIFHFGTIDMQELNCSIMNRWGEEVFSFDGASVGWDGRNFSGMPVPEGAYVYFVTAEGSDGTAYEYRGVVTLVR